MLLLKGPLTSQKEQSCWRTKVRMRVDGGQQQGWGRANCPGMRLPRDSAGGT